MDITKTISALVLAGCTAAACHSPSSPSGSGGASGFQLSLPIAPGDSVSQAYGIWPFGVHGSSHLLDGHPGFDFEYRLGAPVYAPTDATVSGRMPDQNAPGEREVLQLSLNDYLIDITNLTNVPASLQKGSRVSRGQIIGAAGPISIGSSPSSFTSGMIHFGVSDPNSFESNIAPHAVSPDKFMTADARAQLAVIWQTAVYVSEWCEPFLDNNRAQLFPKSRTWAITSGSTPAKIVAGCPAEFPTEYSFIGADGATTETGAMNVRWSARPPSVDFVSSSGSRRLALYDIVGDTMRLAVGAPGGALPPSLAGASVYTTQK